MTFIRNSRFSKGLLIHQWSGLGDKEDKIGDSKQMGTEDWSNGLGGKEDKWVLAGRQTQYKLSWCQCDAHKLLPQG